MYHTFDLNVFIPPGLARVSRQTGRLPVPTTPVGQRDGNVEVRVGVD